jgi:hypothetical protein
MPCSHCNGNYGIFTEGMNDLDPYFIDASIASIVPPYVPLPRTSPEYMFLSEMRRRAELQAMQRIFGLIVSLGNRQV